MIESSVRSTSSAPSRPGGVDLDDAHFRGGRLRDDQLDQRVEGLVGALDPARRALLAAGDPLEGGVDHRFDRRQEAGLLVVEVAVEGAARDPREADQVGHGGRLVALLRNGRDHRREEPLALVALRVRARRPPARAQFALPQRRRISPRSLDHRVAHDIRVPAGGSTTRSGIFYLVRRRLARPCSAALIELTLYPTAKGQKRPKGTQTRARSGSLFLTTWSAYVLIHAAWEGGVDRPPRRRENCRPTPRRGARERWERRASTRDKERDR